MTKRWTQSRHPRQSDVPETTPAPSTCLISARPRVPWWLWPQVVSIDAPVVTVLWLAALAQTHRIHLPQVFYWGLGLVTWLVYLVDRTADAMSGRLASPVSVRHEFCYRHRWATLFLVLPLGGLTVMWIAVTLLPGGLLWQGWIMAMLGAAYLACFAAKKSTWLRTTLITISTIMGLVLIGSLPVNGVPKLVMAVVLLAVMRSVVVGRSDGRWFLVVPKEAVASLLIALGCSVGVHFWVPVEHAVLCIEVILLWVLFFTNLIAISCSEGLAGMHVDPDSLIQSRPTLVAKYRWLVTGVVGTGLYVAISAKLEGHSPGQAATGIVVAISAGLHGVLHLYVRRLPTEIYHLLADAALVAPLPLIWMMGN